MHQICREKYMSRIIITVAIFSLVFTINAQNLRKADNLIEQGLRLYKAGSFEAAIDAFSEAIEITSSLTSSQRYLRGNDLADRASGASFGEQIFAVDPRTAAALVNRGNVYFVLGQMAKALDDYDRAIRISPGLAEAWVCRGSVWLFRREHDRAIEDYSHAIKIDSRSVKGYLGRSMVFSDKGNIKAAFEDLDAVLKLGPNNAEVYYRRGNARRLSGDTNGALEDYKHAQDLDPSLSGPHFGRGCIYYAQRELKAAVAELTKAIELDARTPHALMIRGYALLAMGKDADADRDFKRALAILPQLKDEIDAGIKQIMTPK